MGTAEEDDGDDEVGEEEEEDGSILSQSVNNEPSVQHLLFSHGKDRIFRLLCPPPTFLPLSVKIVLLVPHYNKHGHSTGIMNELAVQKKLKWTRPLGVLRYRDLRNKEYMR